MPNCPSRLKPAVPFLVINRFDIDFRNGHSSDGVASRDEVIWRNPAPRWLPKTAAPVPRRPDGPIHGRNFLYGQSLQATAHSKPSTDFYSAPATSSRYSCLGDY